MLLSSDETNRKPTEKQSKIAPFRVISGACLLEAMNDDAYEDVSENKRPEPDP